MVYKRDRMGKGKAVPLLPSLGLLEPFIVTFWFYYWVLGKWALFSDHFLLSRDEDAGKGPFV